MSTNILDILGGGEESSAIIATEGLDEASRFIVAKTAFDAAKANSEVLKDPVYDTARRLFLSANAGRPVPDSAVLFPTPVGTVRASFCKSWEASKESLKLLPPALVRPAFDIKIDGDDLAPAVAAPFVVELQALAKKYGAKLKISKGMYPVPDFNARRFTEMTPELNSAAEAAGLGTKITLRVSGGGK